MHCAYFHFAWVPSYNLVRKGRGTEGYIMADPKVDPIVMSLIAIDHNVLVRENLFLLLLIDQNIFLI